jgi:oxazoline/thiazoline synthase
MPVQPTVIAESVGATSRSSLGALADLISPRTGIIRSLSRVSCGTEEPTVPVDLRVRCRAVRLSNREKLGSYGGGEGRDRAGSDAGAIGEALERYCSYQHGPGGVIRAAAEDLGSAAIPPRAVVLYSDRQCASQGFPYASPDDLTMPCNR